MKKEYKFSEMKATKNPYAAKKKAVGINLSHEVIDYFKNLAEANGIPYQTLIQLYLLDCVRNKKNQNSIGLHKSKMGSNLSISLKPTHKNSRSFNPPYLEFYFHWHRTKRVGHGWPTMIPWRGTCAMPIEIEF